MHKPQNRIIYDLGANNGDDIAYYLKKADIVVAVEANPVLCGRIRDRFSTQIAEGKLFLEECVLADDSADSVPFYVHDTDPGLSQFPKPPANEMQDFGEVMLPAISVQSLFGKHGHPYYVKVDLEGYDETVLRRLFELGIFPDYISVEAHDFSVFCLLVAVGGYKAFKLVAFDALFRANQTFEIQAQSGLEAYRFPLHHSSGPCSDDLPGAWMDTEAFTLLIGLEGAGWKDIHASRIDQADANIRPHLATYAKRAVLGKMSGLLERLHLKQKKKYTFFDA